MLRRLNVSPPVTERVKRIHWTGNLERCEHSGKTHPVLANSRDPATEPLKLLALGYLRYSSTPAVNLSSHYDPCDSRDSRKNGAVTGTAEKTRVPQHRRRVLVNVI